MTRHIVKNDFELSKFERRSTGTFVFNEKVFEIHEADKSYDSTHLFEILSKNHDQWIYCNAESDILSQMFAYFKNPETRNVFLGGIRLSQKETSKQYTLENHRYHMMNCGYIVKFNNENWVLLMIPKEHPEQDSFFDSDYEAVYVKMNYGL